MTIAEAVYCLFFFFTETWLTDENADFEFEGYAITRFNRDKKKTEKQHWTGVVHVSQEKGEPPTSVCT